MQQRGYPTFAHEIAFDTLDGLSQAIYPTGNFLRELLPSIFPRSVGFFAPLCVLDFIR